MIKGSFWYVRSEGEGVSLKAYESVLGGGGGQAISYVRFLKKITTELY